MKDALRYIKSKILRTFHTDCPRCYKHFYGNKDYGVDIQMKEKEKEVMRSYRYVCHQCHFETKGDKP